MISLNLTEVYLRYTTWSLVILSHIHVNFIREGTVISYAHDTIILFSNCSRFTCDFFEKKRDITVYKAFNTFTTFRIRFQ